MEQTKDLTADRWLGRPWLSRGVRVAVYLIPFLCSILAALVLSKLIPSAHSWPVAIVRLIAVAVGSTVVLFGADRVTRRMLPLAALLSLTLVFPDEAPSRFKIAMRTGGTLELQRRLEEYRRIGADEPALAAQRLLELVADLSQHDRLTRGHSERVRAYSSMIAEELGLPEEEIDRLRWAALLHDIGKLEMPYEILNKPDALTPEEYEVIQRHPGIGARLVAPLAGWLGPSVRAVGEHHERWDGTGYPNGLRKTDISLAARIVAVADTFDVMTSVRSYKKPGSAAEARAELANCAGTQFDANVVRAFLSISLGKLRFAMGPLSWLTQLAFFPTGLAGAAAAAPAMMAVAGMTAAALGTAATPVETHQLRTSTAAVTVVDDFPGAPDHSTVVLSRSTEPDDSPTSDGQNQNQRPQSSDPFSSSNGTAPVGPTSTSTVTTAPDAVDGTVPDQTVPVRKGPTPTTAAPTTAAPASPPAPAAPITTEPPTTPPPPTAAPTTTLPATTVPTTTTKVPPSPAVGTYLLASSAPGDVAGQAVLPLVSRAPLNTGPVPNLDNDRDTHPGRTLRNGTFLNWNSPDRLQRFRLDPAGEIQLNGPVSLVLYAASKDFQLATVQPYVALVDCADSGSCNVFATATVTFAGEDDYKRLTFNFGTQSRTIAASHNLELWIVVTSGRDMWIAYDTTGYESALTIAS
ncbi:MAG: HD-GYP domain-containing protein [Ilumatobacteraceae bacterium]